MPRDYFAEASLAEAASDDAALGGESVEDAPKGPVSGDEDYPINTAPVGGSHELPTVERSEVLPPVGDETPSPVHTSPPPGEGAVSLSPFQKKRIWVLAAALGALLLTAGVVAACVVSSATSPSASQVAAPVSPSSSSPVSRRVREGEVCNTPGDQQSLRGLVTQMQYLYYTRQDAVGVVGLFADPTPVAESIPAAIATQPAGQRWCLRMTPRGERRVAVTIVVTSPGNPTPDVFDEIIEGQKGPDGRWFIATVRALGEDS